MSTEAKTYAHHDFYNDGDNESFTIHNPPSDCSQVNCLINTPERKIVGQNVLARCLRLNGTAPKLETADGSTPQFPEPEYVTPCGLNPHKLHELVKEHYQGW